MKNWTKTIKNILIKYLLFITLAFGSSHILSGCSKDTNLLTQEELVKASNDYKKTVEEIAVCNDLIEQLTEKLETANEDDKSIIKAQIDSETEKLQQLQQQKTELEHKLGINKP